MGADGKGFFDNDEAMDWLAGWEEADEGEGTPDNPGRIAFVIGALAAAVEHKGYLDVDIGECALAAAEAVAAAGGKPGESFNNKNEPQPSIRALAAWARSPHAKLLDQPEVRELARQAIDRSLGDDSEVAALWDESDEAGVWRKGVSELRARLA